MHRKIAIRWCWDKAQEIALDKFINQLHASKNPYEQALALRYEKSKRDRKSEIKHDFSQEYTQYIALAAKNNPEIHTLVKENLHREQPEKIEKALKILKEGKKSFGEIVYDEDAPFLTMAEWEELQAEIL